MTETEDKILFDSNNYISKCNFDLVIKAYYLGEAYSYLAAHLTQIKNFNEQFDATMDYKKIVELLTEYDFEPAQVCVQNNNGPQNNYILERHDNIQPLNIKHKKATFIAKDFINDYMRDFNAKKRLI